MRPSDQDRDSTDWLKAWAMALSIPAVIGPWAVAGATAGTASALAALVAVGSLFFIERGTASWTALASGQVDADLRKPGQSRPDPQPSTEPVNLPLEHLLFLHREGTRADEAHRALPDAEHAGQLVQGGLS